MNKFLENNLRMIGTPTLILIGLIGLFLFATGFVWSRINLLLGEYDAQIKEMNTLQEKANSLESSVGTISNFAQSLTYALPEKNTSLTIVSQLKTLASENSLIMENIKVGAEIKEGAISHVDVTFDLEGQISSIFNMVGQTKVIAPISKLTRFRVSTSETGSRGNITISSYWAAFPTKIPAVSDPLVKITAEEEKLLQSLGSLRRPSFGELSPTVGSVGNENDNPFGI